MVENGIDLNYSKYNTTDDMHEHFKPTTKCKQSEFNLMKSFKFTLDNRFTILFDVISNTSYSNYMIKVSLNSYNQPIAQGYLTVEDIFSIDSTLQDYLLYNRYGSIFETYVLLPIGTIDGLLRLEKADSETNFSIEFDMRNMFSEFNFAPMRIELNDKMFHQFADLIYDVNLSLPFF